MNVIERVARVALRLGVGPNALTTAGFLVVVAAAAAFAGGAVRWGGALVLVSGLFDLLDGRVARLAGRATVFGAVFDAIMDRAGEAVLCAGIALFFLRDGLGRDQLTLGMMAVIAALAMALLAAYVRARAAAQGIESRVGVSPEVARMLLLGAAPLALGAGPRNTWLVWLVLAFAAVAMTTTLHRVIHIARAADGPTVDRRRDTLPGRATAVRKGH